MKVSHPVILILSFVLVIVASLVRPVNPDEPYYTICSSFLLDGKLPYKDFFFHHNPLSLFIYAPISVPGFVSLIAGRILSALLIFFTGLFLNRYLLSLKKGKYIANTFLFLFIFNAFLIDWTVLIRVYALSGFLFVIAVLLFWKAESCSTSGNNRKHFLTGVVLSLLLLTKVTFITNIIFIIICIVAFKENYKRALRNLMLISSGLLVLPLLLLFIYNFDARLIYMHIIESNLIIKQNLQPVWWPNFYKSFLFIILPQNLILILIILFSGFGFSRIELFLAGNILIYFVSHFFTLMHLEYAVSIMPLIILLAVLRFEKFTVRSNKKEKMLKFLNMRNILVLYIIMIPFSLPHFRYLLERKFIMPNVFSMKELISDINNVPGETILSSWEGHSVYSDKKPVMYEYYFSNFFPEHISETEKSIFRIKIPSDFLKAVNSVLPDIIVYDERDPAHLLNAQQEIEKSYTIYMKKNFISIYVRKKS